MFIGLIRHFCQASDSSVRLFGPLRAPLFIYFFIGGEHQCPHFAFLVEFDMEAEALAHRFDHAFASATHLWVISRTPVSLCEHF